MRLHTLAREYLKCCQYTLHAFLIWESLHIKQTPLIRHLSCCMLMFCIPQSQPKNGAHSSNQRRNQCWSSEQIYVSTWFINNTVSMISGTHLARPSSTGCKRGEWRERFRIRKYVRKTSFSISVCCGECGGGGGVRTTIDDSSLHTILPLYSLFSTASASLKSFSNLASALKRWAIAHHHNDLEGALGVQIC